MVTSKELSFKLIAYSEKKKVGYYFTDLDTLRIRSNTNPFKSKLIFPPQIGKALMGSNGEGLHNITARRLKHSPELTDFPHTVYGVPILTKMTDEEKARFYKLLGR